MTFEKTPMSVLPTLKPVGHQSFQVLYQNEVNQKCNYPHKQFLEICINLGINECNVTFRKSPKLDADSTSQIS